MKRRQLATTALIGLFISHPTLSATVVSLGSASSFTVLGSTTVTNTGNSLITGDLGLYPGTSITGFPPGIVSGSIHNSDASAELAQTDALQAFNDLGLMTPTNNLTGQDLARTLTSGVYHFDSDAGLSESGTLFLDGPGAFVFLVESTLTTGSASNISLTNGANAADVFFRVGSSATLGTSSEFVGTIIANTSVTATTGAVIEGRLIALNGAVTLDSNNVAVPEPSSVLGLSLLLGTGLFLRRRAA